MFKKVRGLIFALVVGLVLVGCFQNIQVVSLTTSTESVYLNVNTTATVDVRVLPTDASNKKLDFTISDIAVATVSAEGIITGVSLGNTTLNVKSVSNPKANIVINVYVVDQSWPLEEIYVFAGFNLPAFPEYTSVEVFMSEETLKLEVFGTHPSNVTSSLLAYRDLLINEGWITTNYDNHTGELTHIEHDYILIMHNMFTHNGNHIEFTITEHEHDHDEHAH